MTDNEHWQRVCGDSACVEILHAPDGTVSVRSSLAPERVVTFTAAEWAAFVVAVKEGEVE